MVRVAIDCGQSIEVAYIDDRAEVHISFTTHAIPGRYARWNDSHRQTQATYPQVTAGRSGATVAFLRDPSRLAARFARDIGATLYADEDAYRQAIVDAQAAVPRRRCCECRQVRAEGFMTYHPMGWICLDCEIPAWEADFE